MKIDFTGRGVDITDRIRSFTDSKLERVKKLAEDMHDINVVLSIEKYRNKAEIKFLSQKRSYHGAAEETNDLFKAIDQVVIKLESQVKKFKNKARSKKRNTSDSIRVNVLSLPEAPASGPADGEIRIIRSDNSEVKPMNLEEAVEELQKFNREFLFFRNSDSDLVNVVYQRRDGNIGLIEPGS